MMGNESQWLVVCNCCLCGDWAMSDALGSVEGKEIRIPPETQISLKVFHL